MSDPESPAEALCWLRLRGISLKAVGGHLFASRAPEPSERLQLERFREELLLLVSMVDEVVDLQCSDQEIGPERLRFAPFWCTCGVMFTASDKTTHHRCPVCGRKANREMTYPRRKRDRRADGVTRHGD